MNIKFGVIVATLLLLSNSAIAQETSDVQETAQDKGLRIAQERKEIDQGWQSSESDSLMILRNKQGKESRRNMRNKSLEITGDGDKALTIFDTPRDIKGTAFLSFSHAKKNDDQWLYLPALKRVKRISSRNKSGPFMGSEFSYEDLSSFELDKFNFKYLKNEACGKQDCYVLESVPTDKNSGYTRTVTWLDVKHYRVHKVKFYDRKKSHLKTLTASEFTLYNDKFWRSHKALMVNHLTGKSTEIIISNLKFNTGLSSKDFNKNTLKRSR